MLSNGEVVWEEMVLEELDILIAPVMVAIEKIEEGLCEDPNYDPQPWTWERYLLFVLDSDDGEDIVREILEEYFLDEAEEAARENANNGPCCNDFHCPCGNNNNYPG